MKDVPHKAFDIVACFNFHIFICLLSHMPLGFMKFIAAENFYDVSQIADRASEAQLLLLSCKHVHVVTCVRRASLSDASSAFSGELSSACVTQVSLP